MSQENNYSPYIIIGKLSRDFILTADGNDINDIPGGQLLYTAIGMSPWEKSPGLVARVGKGFPERFVALLKQHNFSTHGIKRIDADIEQRNFISYFKSENQDPRNQASQSMLSQYYKAGKPFPRELLGYNSNKKYTDSFTERTPETILAIDIPKEYLEARCVHLCPMDYLSHNLLPQAFSGHEKRTVTIHADSRYMQPYYFNYVKTLVNGLTSFIMYEQQLRNLFFEKYKIKQLENMMNVLLDYGTENVVVFENDHSYCFINRADRRIKRISPVSDVSFEKIGELSCFCGAYLVGINETYDYNKAVTYGAARASLLKNDINPYNNLDVLDKLVKEKALFLENRIVG